MAVISGDLIAHSHSDTRNAWHASIDMVIANIRVVAGSPGLKCRPAHLSLTPIGSPIIADRVMLFPMLSYVLVDLILLPRGDERGAIDHSHDRPEPDLSYLPSKQSAADHPEAIPVRISVFGISRRRRRPGITSERKRQGPTSRRTARRADRRRQNLDST